MIGKRCGWSYVDNYKTYLVYNVSLFLDIPSRLKNGDAQFSVVPMNRYRRKNNYESFFKSLNKHATISAGSPTPRGRETRAQSCSCLSRASSESGPSP